MNEPKPPFPSFERRDLLRGVTMASMMAATGGLSEGGSGRLRVPAEALLRGSFELEPLPYAPDALAPHISAQTLGFHHGKHHKGYVDKLNELTNGTDLAGKRLEEVMKAAAADASKTALFNNAAQSWNHAFYWKCLKPGGGGMPTGKLLEAVKKDFGSPEKLLQELADACATQFGSGWAWLVSEGGKLEVVKTPNAENPLLKGMKPLFVVDVWEHAYYLDYQNLRKNYVAAVLEHLANWDFVASNL